MSMTQARIPRVLFAEPRPCCIASPGDGIEALAHPDAIHIADRRRAAVDDGGAGETARPRTPEKVFMSP
jgi:hypothetical protein